MADINEAFKPLNNNYDNYSKNKKKKSKKEGYYLSEEEYNHFKNLMHKESFINKEQTNYNNNYNNNYYNSIFKNLDDEDILLIIILISLLYNFFC